MLPRMRPILWRFNCRPTDANHAVHLQVWTEVAVCWSEGTRSFTGQPCAVNSFRDPSSQHLCKEPFGESLGLRSAGLGCQGTTHRLCPEPAVQPFFFFDPRRQQPASPRELMKWERFSFVFANQREALQLGLGLGLANA